VAAFVFALGVDFGAFVFVGQVVFVPGGFLPMSAIVASSPVSLMWARRPMTPFQPLDAAVDARSLTLAIGHRPHKWLDATVLAEATLT